jgi:hypothetical protein
MARIALAIQEVAYHGFTHINMETPEDERRKAMLEAAKKEKEPELPEGASVEEELKEGDATLERIKFVEPLLNAHGILTDKQKKEKEKAEKEAKEAQEKTQGTHANAGHATKHAAGGK